MRHGDKQTGTYSHLTVMKCNIQETMITFIIHHILVAFRVHIHSLAPSLPHSFNCSSPGSRQCGCVRTRWWFWFLSQNHPVPPWLLVGGHQEVRHLPLLFPTRTHTQEGEANKIYAREWFFFDDVTFVLITLIWMLLFFFTVSLFFHTWCFDWTDKRDF